MNLEIAYEVQLANGNIIQGSINCRHGDEVSSLKKKIFQFEGLKNQTIFKLLTPNLNLNSKVNSTTKQLIFRQDKDKNFGSVISVRSRKMSEESLFEEASIIIDENGYENFIQSEPQIPPVVCGYVTFPNSIFFCFSSRKYLVLDTQYLKFYQNETSQLPYKQIQPQQIQQIKSYKKKQFYCIRLLLKQEQINMKFINKDICKQWVGYLNQVLNFSHFLKEKQVFSKKQSFQNYLDTFLKSKNHLDSTNIVKLQDELDAVVLSVHQNIPCENSIKKKSKQIIKLASFQITHKVDSGSFSTIYLAKKDNQIMALKQMNKDKLLYKGQMKYAVTQLNTLIKSKNCPYIIPLYYAFQTYEYLYLALKYIPHGNLSRLIKKRGKLQQNQAIKLIVELIYAIQFLHGEKILYRDLKPDNILINGDGHLYLTDFGLAKQLQDEEEEAHSFLGTPLYLPPERFMNDGSGIDYKSDIYTVGIIFYEMLHGFHPFEADNFNSAIYNIRNMDVEINEDLSPLVKKFLEDTLEKNPDKRVAKMSEHDLFKKLDWGKIKQKEQQGVKMLEQICTPMAQITYQIDEDYTEETYPDKKIMDWGYDFEAKQRN